MKSSKTEITYVITTLLIETYILFAEISQTMNHFLHSLVGISTSPLIMKVVMLFAAPMIMALPFFFIARIVRHDFTIEVSPIIFPLTYSMIWYALRPCESSYGLILGALFLYMVTLFLHAMLVVLYQDYIENMRMQKGVAVLDHQD